MDLIRDFLENGYLIAKNENLLAHQNLKSTIQEIFCNNLDSLHNSTSIEDINKLRLQAFNKLNNIKGWEDIYYSQAKNLLHALIGLDISIQTKLNLSIQMPNDDSSVLMLHTDTLSGQSEFEIVLWVPFTNCYQTNSMYLFDRSTTNDIFNKISDFEELGMNGLFDNYKSKANFINLQEDEILIFSPSLFHGNVKNETETTRVSINCRFKSILAPEFESFPSERKTGSFYKPLRFSPVFEYALKYDEGLIKF